MRWFDSAAFRKLYLTTALRLLALIPLIWWGVITPVVDYRRGAAQTAALEAQQAHLERKIAEKEMLETMDTTFREELSDINQRLTGYYDQQTYLRDINTRTAALKLKLGNVRVTPRRDLLEVNFDVRGDWAALSAFCYELETQATPTRLQRLTVDTDKRGVLTARLNLEMWSGPKEEAVETD